MRGSKKQNNRNGNEIFPSTAATRLDTKTKIRENFDAITENTPLTLPLSLSYSLPHSQRSLRELCIRIKCVRLSTPSAPEHRNNIKLKTVHAMCVWMHTAHSSHLQISISTHNPAASPIYYFSIFFAYFAAYFASFLCLKDYFCAFFLHSRHSLVHSLPLSLLISAVHWLWLIPLPIFFLFFLKRKNGPNIAYLCVSELPREIERKTKIYKKLFCVFRWFFGR